MKKLIFLLTLLSLTVWGTVFSQSVSTLEQEVYAGIRIPFNYERPDEYLFAFNPVTGDVYSYNNTTDELYRHTEEGITELLGIYLQDESSKFIFDVKRDGSGILFWDSGIGRVFDLDLSTLKLERVDQTTDHRNMYGHAATLMDDGTIYAMGGYGFWEHKNFLIKYDPDSREWLKEEHKYEDPIHKGMQGFLMDLEETFFYYIRDAYSRDYSLYRLDSTTNIWKNEPLFEQLKETIGDEMILEFKPMGNTSTYMHSRSRGTAQFFIFLSQLPRLMLIDIKEKKVYDTDLLPFNVSKIYGLFYSERLDKTVIIHRTAANSTRDGLRIIALNTHPSQNYVRLLMDGETNRSGWVWIAGIFILIAASVSGFFVKRRNKKMGIHEGLNEGLNHPESILVIRKNQHQITAEIGGNPVRLGSPDLEKTFFELLYNLVSNRQSRIFVSDFNEHLFGSDDASVISRKKTELLKLLEAQLGSPLFVEKRSSEDARYKILVLNLERVKIDP